jgi:hypothetical protein
MPKMKTQLLAAGCVFSVQTHSEPSGCWECGVDLPEFHAFIRPKVNRPFAHLIEQSPAIHKVAGFVTLAAGLPRLRIVKPSRALWTLDTC